jgi:hypothetical protein
MSVRTALLFALALGVAHFHAQAIRPGFYPVRPPGTSATAGDAAILNGPSQGIGTVYARAETEAVDLLIRERPSDSAPIIAYVGSVQSTDGSLPVKAIAASEPHLIGEFTRVSHDYYGLVVDRVSLVRVWPRKFLRSPSVFPSLR